MVTQAKPDLADRLMTVEEVSAYVQDGRGPEGIRIGRRLRYRRTDVDAWIESRSDSQRPKASA